MTAFKAITTGIGAARRAKFVVFVFYLASLAIAMVTAVPMLKAVAGHLGSSTMGNTLAHDFSTAWLTEFQLANADFLKSFASAVKWVAIAFLVVNTILSAGAFEVFARIDGARRNGESGRLDLRTGLHAFGRGCGRFGGRFFRLALIASVFYYLAFWFWNLHAAKWLDRIFREGVFERGHFYLNLLRIVLLVFTIVVINAVVEYAKAHIVLHERESALAALGDALGFVIARFRGVMAIELGLGALTALAILAYATFARYMPQSGPTTILIWFVVAQVLMWVRWALRLSAWAAAVAYRHAQQPAAVVVATPAEAGAEA